MAFFQILSGNYDDDISQSTSRSEFEELVDVSPFKTYVGSEFLVEFKTRNFFIYEIANAYKKNDASARNYIRENLKYFCKLCQYKIDAESAVEHCANLEHSFRYLKCNYPTEYEKLGELDFVDRVKYTRNLFEIQAKIKLLPAKVSEMVDARDASNLKDLIDKYERNWRSNNRLVVFDPRTAAELSKLISYVLFEANDLGSQKRNRMQINTSMDSLASIEPHKRARVGSDLDIQMACASSQDTLNDIDLSQDMGEYNNNSSNEDENDDDDDDEEENNENGEKKYDLDSARDLNELLNRVLNENKDDFPAGFISKCYEHFDDLEINNSAELLAKFRDFCITKANE